jgi:hypothetical protein
LSHDRTAVGRFAPSARFEGTSYRLTECQYIAIGNPIAKDDLWRINKRRQRIYVHRDVPQDQRVNVAKAHHDKLTTKKGPTS